MVNMRAWISGGPQPVWPRYLLIFIGATALVRVGLGTIWIRESAVLYVLIPYVIGVAIYLLTPRPKGNTPWKNFLRHMRTALIVMLSTSLLLFEGFLCVLIFLPIYVLFAAVTFSTDGFEPPKSSLKASLPPLIILLFSLDGIGGLGPDRETEISRTAVLNLSPEEVRANIIDHAYPAAGRSRFLALFPRPISVEADSFDVGARHVAHMEYRRWGLPGINVHRGTTVLEFTQNTQTHLHAKFVHDDSYLSHYIDLREWSLVTKPLETGQTEVTLTILYDRKLAPAWYFSPLQTWAVGDGLDYALREILGAES